ncbi:hypothetical protein NA57DRAFT_56128 [Rhizodiscina lignyota]|uniref:Extracellular mutant protein 11 C-terminal domain-containing protein n=1 Tax=Rhizodiscina lignyota TaxID=1504668 RepID=A0A9P4ICS4_9PEZI|nr:hypothetical protein NA57DRAFT_56128 [Rhizodiscina lignyota]
MASRMMEFVHRQARSNSPADARPQQQRVPLDGANDDLNLMKANQKRSIEAQRSRISQPRVTRSNLAAQQGQLNHAGQGSMAPPPRPAQPAQPARGAANPFDTDSEHADDTTATSASHVHAHIYPQGYPVQRQTIQDGEMGPHYSDSDNASSDLSDEERGLYEEGEVYEEQTLTRGDEAVALFKHFQLRSGQTTSIFEEGNSYPTTTAGDPENDPSPTDEVHGHGTMEREQDTHVPQHRFNITRMQQTPHDLRNVGSKGATMHPTQGPRQLQQQPPPRPGHANSNVAVRGRALQETSLAQTVTPATRQLKPDSIHKPEQQSSTVHADTVNPASNQQNNVNGDHFIIPNTENTAEKITLDYEPDYIKRMDYSELQQESFDLNHPATPFRLPDQVRDEALSARMAFVASMDATNMAEFFASLTLTEWEEAGDWFLEQFGDLLKKFRAARKHKRAVAEEIEQQVHGRHEQVERKKRKLDHALTNMKQSGAEVLHGTPQKKKK